MEAGIARRFLVGGVLSTAILLSAAGGAAGLYAYIPDVLVVSTGDDADSFLSEMEVLLGVEAADDPLNADRPDLNRLDREARVMYKHWQRLDAECDPNAVFALMYLVTTYGVRDHIRENYFADNDYLAIITVAFAEMYLDAYHHWLAGEPEKAPPAWVEAFDWAASGQSSITEDEFLGMNAHINYDLAIAEAAVGIVDPETGESRKPDMDRINHVLADVTDDVGYWIAAYYGPTAPTTPPSDAHTESPPGDPALLILEPVYGWREHAWMNAIAITEADGTAAREVVDADMRAYSWTIAQGLQSPKLVSEEAARIAYCQANPPAGAPELAKP